MKILAFVASLLVTSPALADTFTIEPTWPGAPDALTVSASEGPSKFATERMEGTLIPVPWSDKVILALSVRSTSATALLSPTDDRVWMRNHRQLTSRADFHLPKGRAVTLLCGDTQGWCPASVVAGDRPQEASIVIRRN